jgi:hypothetical protein
LEKQFLAIDGEKKNGRSDSDGLDSDFEYMKAAGASWTRPVFPMPCMWHRRIARRTAWKN